MNWPSRTEEELVVVLVFVPVIFALHDSEPDDGVVDLGERLVVPLIATVGDEVGDVDDLQ